MGTRYTKKNLGDPNWSKPNNYKIKQNDAIYDVEIVPNKGVKGDVSAQPFNDQNAEDIENALVSLDDDLAFIEADYINNAEHALKQDVTDNDLNTTDKTVVGAINEVKSEGEYHDLLQDDAIAIVNNKINALPMNGSLKNIRTSLVGIPTTFTNIDMFNTKQTVTNYQPLSLDYKGAAEPHIILMKTIGDYTFDFAVEATHTNGTDTTIVLEAWVDGVLYDTATRTLVGGSNQINGVTGFFTYSKGTDTVPSEIYFRFRASQGNTSANKTLINTTLFGNSAENSFTDTDHVTGTNLNEPTYNGATTSFIINDLRSDLNVVENVAVRSVDGLLPDPVTKDVKSLQLFLNNVDIAYVDSIHGASTYDNILLDLFTKGQTNVGNDKPFILNFVIKKDVVMTNLATSTINFIFNEHGYVIDPIKEINFKMECTTSVGDSNYESHDFANVVSVWGDGFYFEYVFDYDDFTNVIVYRIKRTRGTGIINLWSGPATNSNPIILTKSIFDMGFDFLRVTTSGSQIKVDGFTRNMTAYRGVTSARISGGDVEHIFACDIGTDGVTLTPREVNYTYSKTLQTPASITIDNTLSVTQIDGGWYD